MIQPLGDKSSCQQLSYDPQKPSATCENTRSANAKNVSERIRVDYAHPTME
jgi:hypothetical protein